VKSTERPACTNAWPMAHAACVLPTPGRPKISTLSPRSRKSPPAISRRIFTVSGRGSRCCSKVARVLPGGSEARRRRSTRRSRRSWHSSSSTSQSTGSAWSKPPSAKRRTSCSTAAGSLNAVSRAPMRLASSGV
jgi:hypothetical protein